ncbi:hypothetical protein H8S23_10520 [Anaerofilum sp. BX8]|uniref:Uncharacterized protein n=1 Tax=Anaerofilum hominis TaxID=2763016 RepID=A0A923I8S2_9FIRM|nr:hypothetical protein [Anaerofilum hominis]MBC5581944.1 hypothetical protein [Anaerofilum hominis]
MRPKKWMLGTAAFLLCLCLAGCERKAPAVGVRPTPAPTATATPGPTVKPSPTPKPTPAPEESRQVYEMKRSAPPPDSPSRHMFIEPDQEDDRTIRDLPYCPVSEYPYGETRPLVEEAYSPDYTGPQVRSIGGFSLSGEIWENLDPDFTGEYPISIEQAKQIAKAAFLDIYAAEELTYVQLGIEDCDLFAVGRHVYYGFRSFEIHEDHTAHAYNALVSVEDGEVWLTGSSTPILYVIEVPQPVLED